MGKTLRRALLTLNVFAVFLLLVFFIKTRRFSGNTPLPAVENIQNGTPFENIVPAETTQNEILTPRKESTLHQKEVVASTGMQFENELPSVETTPNDMKLLFEDCNQDRLKFTQRTVKLSGKYLVIGAISYPGYIVSKVLKANKVDYKITEDISSLGFDLGTWNNYDKLVEIGITPSILDYSDKNVVKSQFKWLGNDGTLIYIPSLLFNANTSPFDVEYTSSIMKNFIHILEMLSKLKKVKVIYFTRDGTALETAAINQFSLLLSSYARFHDNIQTSFITIESDGKKTVDMNCGSEDEVNRVIALTILESRQCRLKCSSVTEHSRTKQRDLVTSTYFFSGGKFKKDCFQFMKGFYMSALKQKLEILLFHDGLGNMFMNKLKHYYSKIELVKINNLNGRSKNDARFYILRDYILKHPEVRSIVLQDIRDGMFPGNPFKVMDIIGDLIYVGLDKSFYVSAYDHPWMKGLVTQLCHRDELHRDQIKYYPFFNAGTLGGTRDVMLTFLTRLIKYFDKTPHNRNCNMATVHIVAHNHYFDHSYSGYPFEGYTESRLGSPRGLAVRHKDTQYI